jgi:multidrug resistance efflux pump
VVTSRSVTEGELVMENAELFTLVDPTTMVFLADIPFGNAPRPHRGQPAVVEFSSLPPLRFAGRVDAIY